MTTEQAPTRASLRKAAAAAAAQNPSGGSPLPGASPVTADRGDSALSPMFSEDDGPARAAAAALGGTAPADSRQHDAQSTATRPLDNAFDGLPLTPSARIDADAALAASLGISTPSGTATPAISGSSLGSASPSRAQALRWVDPARVAAATHSATSNPADAPVTAVPAVADLLASMPRRSALRPGVLVPCGILVGIVGVYVGTTALWPLHAVSPTVTAVETTLTPAPLAAVTWPGQGSAAVGIDGLSAVASSEEAAPMASITKVVTVLAALERMPLGAGEQGPSFAFDDGDSDMYWDYRESDQSALDVPVDGALTEYQLMQGILIGSANNYADRLSDEIWGSDSDFAAAASTWLRERGLGGITATTPSGFDFGNTATPRALLDLAAVALRNPVVAEIVATPVAEIPGAGAVENTNGLLADGGVVGVKTGTIGDGDETLYNLLSAKDITVDGVTVRVYVSMLGQTDNEARLTASRTLYAEVEAALTSQAPTLTGGTVVGTVSTAWGESAEVVTAEDARVVLWNGAAATAASDLKLKEWAVGSTAGSVTVTGPLNDTTVDAELSEELAGPSLWWRLTHPLELFGIGR